MACRLRAVTRNRISDLSSVKAGGVLFTTRLDDDVFRMYCTDYGRTTLVQLYVLLSTKNYEQVSVWLKPLQLSWMCAT